ncbi:rhomboid family intramembrane serine protease [Gordonia sp. NB41Y]|uniref:rhomboid family intramembrane serine protease n=1 Tax=Gordonia sp. NB41Y TaxID=875808 RepID=UPI0006B1931F|nr:rhomboid family intramembrane serine protease [Gordonia sp. NB41Y]EMP15234.2 protease [Gordonia sp. NB41Y]WLP88483.1 rhomboid family intramembrane serine protease [Gordonia sp. NB41Y]
MCYRHPDRPTALSCTRCGRPACPECLRPAAVGAHCVDCLRTEGSHQQVRTPHFSDQGVRPVVGAPLTVRRPIATYSLIGINVAVFLWTVIAAGSFDVQISTPILYGEIVRGNVVLGEYYRLFTAGFLHYSVLHLAVNMISLYILGRDLEVALGIGRYLMVYVISLFGGSAAVMLAQANEGRSAGASGAIFGLMGAMLIVVLRLRVSPAPVITIIVINLVMSFTISGISLPAHVGGLLFGAAATAAVIYGPRLLPAAQRTQRNANIVGWSGLGVLLLVAIAISVLVAVTYTGQILVYVR